MVVLAIILAFTNISVVACMHVAYRAYGKCKDNMVLGVTFSQEQIKDSEIQELAEQYKSAFRKLMLAGYITGILAVIPFKWYISIAMIVYLVWMFGYIILVQYMYIKYHKKMYAIKKEKGYTCGKIVNGITIDTRLNYAKDKMPVSWCWFLPSILVLLLPFSSKSFQKYLLSELETAAIIFGVIILVKAAYILMYYLFAKRGSVVYSLDSDVNIRCNYITKRGHSIIFTVACFCDSLSFLVLLWDETDMGYMSMVSVILFVLMQAAIVVGMIAAMYHVKKKRNAILAQDTQAAIVDEDEFWASGFYYNPMDTRLFVPDRQSGMNMTMNMAKSASWVIGGVIGIGTLAVLLCISVLLIRLDFVAVKYQVADNFRIMAPSYSRTIEYDEIQSVKLLDEFPDIKMSKQNGAATDQYALGRFHIRNEGTCYLYIYYGYSPVIELQLEDMKIYCNSKEEGTIQECYQELQEKISQVR